MPSSSSLMSTFEVRGPKKSGLSTNGAATNGLSWTFPVTTSLSNTGAQENASLNDKQEQLYKTEFCRNWIEYNYCRYGRKCRYAHGKDELRQVSRSSRYKTRICRTYHIDGTCIYGNRCTFIHGYQDWIYALNAGYDLWVDSSFSFMYDGFIGNSDYMENGTGLANGGKLRQHSRFFGPQNISKDHQVSSLQLPAPQLSTLVTTNTLTFQNNGIWNSQLGLGSPQPLAHNMDSANHQFITSPILTTTPMNTIMSNDYYAPATLYQNGSQSVPAHNNTSINQFYNHFKNTYATPSHDDFYEQHYHDLDTSTTTLNTEITDPLSHLEIDDSYSSPSSLDPIYFE